MRNTTTSDKNNTNERELDELDALLSKVESNENVLTYAATASSKRSNENNKPKTSQHKKSVSLFAWGSQEQLHHSIDHHHHHQSTKSKRSRHRKNKSSISELLYNAIREYDLDPIREDFRQTSKQLQERFVKDLKEMDKGQVGFFDMGMTRSLSVLPEDISDLALESTAVVSKSFEENNDEDEHFKVIIDNESPKIWFRYAALFLAVFAISSKSTGFHMLDNVQAPLKQYWKMQASSVGLSPLAIHYFTKNNGIPKLSFSQWLTFMAAIVCYSVQNVLFVKALEYTTVGNACIYANSQALLLIVGKACVGDQIHWMEGIGVLIAFSGAILCTEDAEKQSMLDFENPTSGKIGDGLALLSAVAGVLYLTFAKAVRSGISVTVFVFSVMFFGQWLILFYMQLSSYNLEYNLNMYDGVFGWLNVNRLPVMIYMVLVVNFVGTMGFVRAMEYFDNIVIAVATLMEPLLASLIAFACNAGLLPGSLGWLGNLLVVLGTLAVVYPSVGKESGNGFH